MAPDLDCSTPPNAMKGYLRKPKKLSKRYFVLREEPLPKLEYYDSTKCYVKNGKPNRSIELENAWNIDKKVTAKHKHLIGIYTEAEYFCMVAENESTQGLWVNALQKAVLNYKGHANRTHIMYRHIWQGSVDTKDLDKCDNTRRINLQGVHRCCLTNRSMVFIRVSNSGGSALQHRNHVEIKIASIRTCGHTDNMFFMEPGRSSGIGTGKLWMELDDSAIADNMHRTILDFMCNQGQEDQRPRSYSSGSGGGRTGNRSRYYYNPPPSQVGMGKLPSTTANTLKSVPYYAVSRNRCETFPATQAATLSDEARYRTSSEGETTMKRHYPFHALKRKPGSVSPGSRARVYSQGKRPLYLQQTFPHFRTSSLPGSYTSSSNSSIEHLNKHDFQQNGHSPALSEGHGSSDEFSSSPLIDTVSHGQIHQFLLTHAPSNIDKFVPRYSQMAPPPPSMPPQATPTICTSVAPNSIHMSDYAIMQPSHSRSPSLDDNLSCDTGASSLSTSPHVYLPREFASPDASFIYSQSPSQSSSHSHCSDFNLLYTPASTSPGNADSYDYAMMSPGGSNAYPHENSPPSADYTLMTPGRGVASTTPTENKNGYVPMRPLARSQPQDISSSRRRSVSDNRLVHGSYSPASPLSRSPDKTPRISKSASTCMVCRRPEMPHSFPCQCASVTIAARRPSIPSVSCHGLKVDARNDFSADSNKPAASLTPKSSRNYSEDYAIMAGLTRGVADVQVSASVAEAPKQSPKVLRDPDINETEENGIDHEYLPMSPMNAGSYKKSVVGNVLSIAESAPKQPTSSSKNTASAKYPHQQSISKPGQYSTNSLDRSSKHPRRRTKSLFASSLVAGHRHSTRASKNGRKHSLRINTDSKSVLTSESSNNRQQPPCSPGGEYVSINFDKAKKHVGPNYVSLSGASGDSEISTDVFSSGNRRIPGTPKVTHDSNRNLLHAKESPPNDDYMILKPGHITGDT